LGLAFASAVWAMSARAQVEPQNQQKAASEEQVLATVGKLTVTADELESAIASSPFATQFASMDQDDQAALRGDLLQRLVYSRLFRLEAERLGLDKSERFKKDLDQFRLGLLYRHYMDRLRERIEVPPDVLMEMKRTFKGNPDGLAAAQASYRVDRYRAIRLLTLQQLKERYGVKLHEDRIDSQVRPDTVLLEGEGIKISYGELVEPRAQGMQPNPAWVKEQLYKRAELLLIALAAEGEGVDVSDKVARYKEERLPALLIETKAAEWVPSEEVLRKYYKDHPKIGWIPERRHIGQLVAASREKAEKLRTRIQAGESLFKLAGKFSIDEQGRARNGDMGWVIEGQGMPELEAAVAGLEEGQVSEVVATPKGFHLVTVLERMPGGQKTFAGIKDRVKQLYIGEKLAQYTADLGKKYNVVWNVIRRHAGTGQ